MRVIVRAALILAVSVGPAWAADYHAGPEDYRAILPRLAAGDRLLLRAGDYLRGLLSGCTCCSRWAGWA